MNIISKITFIVLCRYINVFYILHGIWKTKPIKKKSRYSKYITPPKILKKMDPSTNLN